MSNDYKILRPFQLFMKNNFPFIENTFESMDIYVLLCDVVKYLNEVIENSNGLVSNMNELNAAFIQIKDYVDHYFDNLDVQEEINTKLDEMVEDGTLENIINQEIFTSLYNSQTGWKNVVTLGELDNTGTTANDTAFATFLSTVEEGDVIYFPSGTYLFNNKVEIENLLNVTFRFEGTILSNNGVLLYNLERVKFYDLKITRTYTRTDITTLANTGLELKSVKHCVFYNPYVAGFNKGYYWHGYETSNSYNYFYNIVSYDNKLGWSVLNESGGFTNEIQVFGGRFSVYAPEENLSGIVNFIDIPANCSMHNFYGVCLEGAHKKVNLAGASCSFIGCRFEYQDSGLQDVVISGNNNTFLGCYWSQQTGGSSIVNTGNYNTIDNSRQMQLNKVLTQNTKIITANYTLGQVINNILCDCSNGNITVTLPIVAASNHKNSVIRIQKIDNTNNYVSLTTSGQSHYDYVGRGALLKNLNDFVELYLDQETMTWRVIDYRTLYKESITNINGSNIIEGLVIKDGLNPQIVKNGGTIFSSQITNTYANTTANSKNITLTIGSANMQLQVGNYIKIAGEDGYFKIETLDLPNLAATLDRVCTNTATNKQITFQAPVYRYLGLIYGKVDSLPSVTADLGDIAFYNSPVAGGYVGAIYTTTGWKNFGAIES